MRTFLIRSRFAAAAFLLFGITCTELLSAAPVLLDDRFELPKGFHIYKAAEPDLTGGSYDLTFDGQGRLLVGDGEAVRRLADTDGDQMYDTSEVIATGLGHRGPQGLLVYGDRMYAVGSDGVQLFTGYESGGELKHEGRLGQPFRTGGDHDAHALIRGIDGWIYFVVGDGAGARDRMHITEDRSPVIRERTGCVFRFNPAGDKWECISAGGRNAPNLGMNYLGEFFSFDSDMEWHVDLPWYRPVRLNHWLIGGDQGWQHVNAYPPYFIDCLPPVMEVGRGSPNWGVVYEHRQLPDAYHDSFIACDYRWKSATTGGYDKSGRLVAFHLKRRGASWNATMEVLAQAKEGAKDASGEPIGFALVDIDVAPDGSLLVTDHGQGIWRIFYDESESPNIPPIVPDGPSLQGDERQLLERLVTLPQPAAEWSRVQEDQLRAAIGPDVEPLLRLFALNTGQPVRRRLRAIRLLAPSFEKMSAYFLGELGTDPETDIRAQAVWLCGIIDPKAHGSILKTRLFDVEPFVRRRACEALTRTSHATLNNALIARLADKDRTVRFAAMTALAHRRQEVWIEEALKSSSPQILMRALVAGNFRYEPPRNEWVQQVVNKLLDNPPRSHENRLDLLRILGKYRQSISKDSALHQRVTEYLLVDFPHNDRDYRWEQIRLLGEYNVGDGFGPLLESLTAERNGTTQFHVAQALSKLTAGWTDEQQNQLVEWVLERQGGWFADFRDKGLQFPHFWATMLDRIVERHEDAFVQKGDRIQSGSQLSKFVFSAMAKTSKGRAKLIELLQRKSKPQSGNALVRALATPQLEQQHWPILLKALASTADRETARSCIRWLAENKKPFDAYGSPLQEMKHAGHQGAQAAAQRLLEIVWEHRDLTGDVDAALQSLSAVIRDRSNAPKNQDAARLSAIEFWQDWYRKRFGQPFLAMNVKPHHKPLTDDAVHALILDAEIANGIAPRGRDVYVQVRCFACHGGLGNKESTIFGPSLLGVTQRLKRVELADALVHPSKQVADRFKANLIETDKGKFYIGFVTEKSDQDVTIVTMENEVVKIGRANIAEMDLLETSLMPTKLLNPLSEQQIRDLLAFLDTMK